MRAAGLKAIDTVVESTAVLISSKHPSDAKLVSKIVNRIKGVITAQKYVLCTYNCDRKILAKVSEVTPGKRAPTVNSLEEEGWVAVSAMVSRIITFVRGIKSLRAERQISCAANICACLLCDQSEQRQTVSDLLTNMYTQVEKSEIANVMDELTELGATDILVTKIDNSRTT